MLDVLFIHPDTQRELYQGLADNRETAIEPPLWCRLLSSYIEGKGLSSEILDAEALGLRTGDVAAMVAEAKPVLAVIVLYGHNPSASTQMMPAATETTKAIKRVCDIPVLIVGGHAAALPERTLEETEADFVCNGEGPVSVHAVTEFIKSYPGRNWRWGTKVEIPGVCYWDHDNIIDNDPAPNVNLEEMPGGQWHKLPGINLYRSYKHHANLGTLPRQPYASIYTSLNCPYACSFCMIRAPFVQGDKLKSGRDLNIYRTWPASIVIKEIKVLVEKYDVSNLRFNDEMFALKPSHVHSVCDAIIESGYGDFLNSWFYARVDSCRPEFLDKMRKAGFRWACIGIESESNDVRDGVSKADYGHDDIIETCRRVRESGMNLLANFMVLPTDTPESVERTYQLALEIMPEYLNIYATMPFPGSTLYNQVKDHWNPDGGWKAYSYLGYDTVPLPTPTMTSTEVLRARDEFFNRFFSEPSYLTFIEKKFGVKAVEEIKSMAKVRLRRRLLGDWKYEKEFRGANSLPEV